MRLRDRRRRRERYQWRVQRALSRIRFENGCPIEPKAPPFDRRKGWDHDAADEAMCINFFGAEEWERRK